MSFVFTIPHRSHRGALYSPTLAWSRLPYKLLSNSGALNYAAQASKYLKSMITENSLLLFMLRDQTGTAVGENVSSSDLMGRLMNYSWEKWDSLVFVGNKH